ncbi:hypothetical protein IQ225_10770 [Synechocystis salina LEGE 06155]|nr:hypothetical protein [Synechocystis salina LEGE 06155]
MADLKEISANIINKGENWPTLTTCKVWLVQDRLTQIFLTVTPMELILGTEAAGAVTPEEELGDGTIDQFE